MKMNLPAFGSDYSDLFDSLPDPIILQIFNRISDVKALIRCRSVSRRFNSLVPQSDSLLLRVDRVISATDSDSDDDDNDSVFLNFLRSILKSFHSLISNKHVAAFSDLTRLQNSPAEILRGFERVRSLQIELPAGDLKLEKGTSIKWKAHFGKTLRSCVILGFCIGGDGDLGGRGLKMRVVWTISALISAAARHYMMVDVIREQNALTNVVVTDKDDEGTVVMDKIGLKEFRLRDRYDEDINSNNSNGGVGIWWKSNRTPVPAVRMRMRHGSKIELSNGSTLEGATLVVVRPVNVGGVCNIGGARCEVYEHSCDVELAMSAFGGDGVYREAVEKLLKSKTYILEMNSF